MAFEQMIKDMETSFSIPFDVNGVFFFALASDIKSDVKKRWHIDPTHYSEVMDPNRIEDTESLKCKACRTRATEYCGMVDSNGNDALFGSVKPENLSPLWQSISFFSKHKSAEIYISPDAKCDVILCESDTFPGKIDMTAKAVREDYEHIFINPDPLMVTNSEKARRFRALYDTHVKHDVFNGRFSSILSTTPEMIGILDRAASESYHEYYYKPTIEFIKDIIAYANGKKFEDMSSVEKVQVKIYAITIGRVNLDCSQPFHIDMKTVGMFHSTLFDKALEELSLGSGITNIVRTMNTLRDEGNYQISRVTKRLEDEGVSGLVTISLIWYGKDESDLDLHVVIQKKNIHCFYGKKIVTYRGDVICKLDFDANAGRPEPEPCENITLTEHAIKLMKPVEIYVNNYSWRNPRESINYTVVVKQQNKPTLEFNGVWPSHMKDNPSNRISDMNHVTTIDFSKDDLPNHEDVMTEKDAKKLIQQKEEFAASFGESPYATIATEHEVPTYVALRTSQTLPSKVSAKGRRTKKVSALDEITSMASMTLTNATRVVEATIVGDNVGDAIQAEVVSAIDIQGSIPSTFPNTNEMLHYAADNGYSIQVDPSELSPGFLTKIHTESNVIYNNGISPVHFESVNKQGGYPTCRGTARMRDLWFSNGNNSRVNITGFVINSKPTMSYFVTLENACLPPVDNFEFPLKGSAGFNPTCLKPDVHHLRSMFTTVGTQITPTIRPSLEAAEESNHMIGAFLFDEGTFYMNDKRVTIS